MKRRRNLHPIPSARVPARDCAINKCRIPSERQSANRRCFGSARPVARAIPLSDLSIRLAPIRRARGSAFGFSLVELIVALILLGTVMSIVVPALGWMGHLNRHSLQRQEAVQGLHNLMDELTSRPYEKLTPEAAANIELPPTLKDQLPGATLEVEIQEAEPKAKRIRLELGWNQRNGRPLAPTRLTAWVYKREGKP